MDALAAYRGRSSHSGVGLGWGLKLYHKGYNFWTINPPVGSRCSHHLSMYCIQYNCNMESYIYFCYILYTILLHIRLYCLSFVGCISFVRYRCFHSVRNAISIIHQISMVMLIFMLCKGLSRDVIITIKTIVLYRAFYLFRSYL